MAKKKQKPRQRQRAEAQASNSRRRQRRRTGKKTLHYMLLVIFVLAAGIVLSLTTFFKIEEVRVVGTDKYAPQDIIASSGILPGENLFRVPTGQVAELLQEAYPYVETAKVRRKLPPAIEIEITQAAPAAAIFEQQEVVLITADGKVLERGEVLVPPQVPVIQGISAHGVLPGEYLDESNHEALAMVTMLLEAAASVEFEGITNVDVTSPTNMLVIYENRVLLKFGTESDLDHKLIFIKAALPELGDEWEGRIDVTNAKNKKQLVAKDISLEEALRLENKHPAEVVEEAESKPAEDEPLEDEQQKSKTDS